NTELKARKANWRTARSEVSISVFRFYASMSRFFILHVRSEKALICERSHHRNHSNSDKSSDAVELVKLCQVMEEQFQHGDAEQTQRRISRPHVVFENAVQEQHQREQGP